MLGPGREGAVASVLVTRGDAGVGPDVTLASASRGDLECGWRLETVSDAGGLLLRTHFVFLSALGARWVVGAARALCLPFHRAAPAPRQPLVPGSLHAACVSMPLAALARCRFSARCCCGEDESWRGPSFSPVPASLLGRAHRCLQQVCSNDPVAGAAGRVSCCSWQGYAGAPPPALCPAQEK